MGGAGGGVVLPHMTHPPPPSHARCADPDGGLPGAVKVAASLRSLLDGPPALATGALAKVGDGSDGAEGHICWVV
jgi:hypothetical protein